MMSDRSEDTHVVAGRFRTVGRRKRSCVQKTYLWLVGEGTERKKGTNLRVWRKKWVWYACFLCDSLGLCFV
jgi:hypothetical protein